MRTGKIVLEEPQGFPAPAAGYERPAGGGSLPPGWLNTPEEDGQSWREQEPLPPEGRMTAREFVDAATESRHPASEVDAITLLAEALKRIQPQTTAGVPDQRVNLETGAARFMGYDVQMTEDGLESIKIILAMEVCRQLESERDRVLNAVQQQGVPTASGGWGPDMPPLPPEAFEVESGPSSRFLSVFGVREQEANSAAEDVRAVPGTEAGAAGEGAGPQPVVPGDDAGSLPQPGELLQRDGTQSAQPAKGGRPAKRRSHKPRKRVRSGKRATVSHEPE